MELVHHTEPLAESVHHRLVQVERLYAAAVGKGPGSAEQCAESIEKFVRWWRKHDEQEASQVTATITGGPRMGITVDTTDGAVTLTFKDKDGDPVGVPTGNDGNPITISMTSDNPGALTLTPGDNPLSQAIVPVAEGNANVDFAFTNTDGSPATYADGTPIACDPVSIPVGPGAAVSVSAEVTGG